MIEDDPYRQNPAHDVEAVAVRVVGSWVGRRGVVKDTSAGPGPDFQIDYVNGRVAIGEVGWHEDPVIREMWANVFRRELHQQIPLRQGQGRWAVQLVVGASINALYRHLPSVIEALLGAGQTKLNIYGGWPRGELADSVRNLGIDHLERVNTGDPAVAIFFIPGGGGVLATDPDVIADWVELVLSDPDYADTTRKLLPHEADERHVFLMSGSRTDFSHQQRLMRLDDQLPRRPPRIPEGITHVWGLAQFGGGPAALWARETGWSAVSVPTPDT